MTLFLAFLGVSLMVIVTPGPDTAITIRNTLLGGRAGGVFTALGIASGQVVWALATSAGIVALFTASELLFLVVKYAGASYLVYLGIQVLRDALRRGTTQAVTLVGFAPRLKRAAAFRQGIISDLSNLSNPKMAVFFASLLPQFAPAGAQTFTALLCLGLVFAAMTVAWLVFYAVVISNVGNVLNRPAVRRSIEGVTGVVLIGLGLRVAAEHR